MAEKEKMPDEVAKRGRPKKEIIDPVINEAPMELEMEDKTSIQKLNYDLVELYNRVVARNPVMNALNLNTYNPFLQNDRLKALSTKPASMQRDELITASLNPGQNELKLRAHSQALSASQYMYYKILRMYCDVPMFNYYVTPENLDSSIYKKKDFIEDDNFVNDWLYTFDLKNTLKRVSLEVKREGKCTYLLRNKIITDEKGNRKTAYCTWQKLPNEFVKLVKIGEHGFIASFNLMIFMNPSYSLSQYPDYITDVWNQLVQSGAVSYISRTQGALGKFKINDIKKLSKFAFDYQSNASKDQLPLSFEIRQGKASSEKEYMMWLQLPQTLCYTFCSDTSHPWVVPDTTGLLLPLDELADYDTLQGLVESTPLTAILTGEAETIPNPNPGKDQTIINPETLEALQERFNQSTSTNLEALFAPLKNFQLLSLPSQPNSSEISANATKNVITRAGIGGLMITTDKPSVAQVKAAELLIEAEVNFVTLQFESVLNMIIQELIGCKYIWKLHIWGGIFTFSDEFDRDKELFSAGATFVLPKIASAYGLTMRDLRGTSEYVDSLNIYDYFKTVTQVNQEKIQSQNQVGRPSKKDSDIDNDNTAASKDSGLDTSDTRD